MMKFLSSHTEKTSFSASDYVLLSKNTDLTDVNDYYDEYVRGDFEEDTESLKSIIPHFKPSEIYLGDILGVGGFCVVRELSGIDLEETTNKCNNSDGNKIEVENHEEFSINNTDKVRQEKDTQLRKVMMSVNLYRNKNNPEARYAVKRLRGELEGEDRFHAMIDLAIETRFLSMIRHPNIIRMRGIAETSPLEDENFIVIDRLYDTLEQRIEKWQFEEANMKLNYSCFPNCRNISFKKMPRGDSKILWEKFDAASDLASALKYLHSKRIMHRDLKPQNIGFDVRNNIRLFDFGLAKQLEPKVHLNDIFKYTGCVGSLRYMAPEIKRSAKYGLSADVYSFGLMLWQILSTDLPFAGFTPKLHSNLVVNQCVRPKLRLSWSDDWCHLMEKCWANNIDERLTMTEVFNILDEECYKLCIDNKKESGIRRKSSTSIYFK